MHTVVKKKRCDVMSHRESSSTASWIGPPSWESNLDSSQMLMLWGEDKGDVPRVRVSVPCFSVYMP